MTSYIRFLQANVANLIPVVKEDFCLPAASSLSALKASQTLAPTDGVTTVNITTFLRQPNPPRKLILTFTTAGDAGVTGTLEVVGKSLLGKDQTDILDVIASESTYKTERAFATVSAIRGSLTGADNDDTLDVGMTCDLQLMYPIEKVLREEFDGALVDGVGDADKVANTYAVCSSLDGDKDLVVYYKRK